MRSLFTITAFCAAAGLLLGQPSAGQSRSKTAPKPAAKPAAKPAPTAAQPSGPKLLTVVAGRPFEQIPSSGPSRVSIVMCAEETEPATFSVRYSKPLAGVRVAMAADLTGPGKIERTNVEVSLVNGSRLVNQVSASTGAVFALVDIGPQPVQLWVNVTVPRRTPPGNYRGSIGFYHDNKLFDSVPLEVQVLPLRLIGSSKQYAVFTSYGPGGQGSAALNGQDYQRFLEAFRRLQFRSVTLNTGASDAASALTIYRTVGLAEPAGISTYALGNDPVVEEVSALEDGKKTAGIGRLVYFCADNPCSEEDLQAAEERASVIRSGGGRVTAKFADERAVSRLEPALDEMCYWVEMPIVRSFIDGTARPAGWKWQWMWWDARKSVTDNRLYAGIALWRSGLYGALAVWLPEEGRHPLDGLNGLLGEALREGIDDTRYLTTYMKALRELKDLKRERDKDYIASTETYVAAFLKRPLDQIKPSDLAAFRARLAEYAIALEKRL